MRREHADAKFAITTTRTTTSYTHCTAQGKGPSEREGPTWNSAHLVPAPGRRNEQLYIDTRKALCSIRGFQEDIKAGKLDLSAGCIRDSIAEGICETWKITEGIDWVLWLLEHWDPAQSPCPPLSPEAPAKSFSPWTLKLDYLTETKDASPVCRVATITLHAGISKHDGERLIDFVFEKLSPAKGKGGRPRLTDFERNMMRAEFRKLGIPKPSKRRTMILKVQRSLVANGSRKIGETAIGKELRAWLIERGEKVRHYSYE